MTARQGNLLSVGATLLFTLTVVALAVFRWAYSVNFMTLTEYAGALIYSALVNLAFFHRP